MKNRELSALLRLSPRFQKYDWGDPSIIPNLLRMPPTGEPFAEAWFGAHPLAPADALLHGRWRPLDQVIERAPERILGARVKERYGALPYLLKILAAVRPLSIQVHADSARAEAGFALEEAAGIPLHAPHRRYKDRNHKPEVLVALSDFYALSGFRPPHEIAHALDSLPELRGLLPRFEPTPNGLRELLAAYFAIPKDRLGAALSRLALRLSLQEAVRMPGTGEPSYWAALAHRELSRSGVPDPGLKFIFLLSLVHLRPGQAIFLPPGTPHAYLRGTGIELMASSDNVLRAGLTSKYVDTEELLKVLEFDFSSPTIIEPEPDGEDEETYRVPAAELGLGRMRVGPGTNIERTARGPETLIAMPEEPSTQVIVESDMGRLRLSRGQACLVPDGVGYSVRAGARATVFRALVPHLPEDPRAAAKVYLAAVPSETKKPVDGGDGAEPMSRSPFVGAIRRNIVATDRLFAEGGGAKLIGTVSGSESARAFWQRQLDGAREGLGAREALSFHEDLPVGQAFGLLLLWQRLRPRLRPGDGALFAFVFGEGTRAAPFTEAECGQKPAIRSFVATEGRDRRLLSIVELALRYFSLVESHLRRSGFDGLVVKWGDEVQIPTRDLSGTSPLFRGADVVRFVSMQKITPDQARNKDWVGVDAEGRVTAFIPRRPIEEMEALADRGLIQRRDDGLYGGVNLGSIALSRDLLEVLLEEFQEEIRDPDADRRLRPDLDPQLFTALTIAAIPDPEDRARAWTEAMEESERIRRLQTNMPGVLDRLRTALDRFEGRHGRGVRMVAMDFGDQYWGDIGQHKQIGDFFLAVAHPGSAGEIARALAGLPEERDENGNIFAGKTVLGEGVRVRGSVLIDVHVDAGEIVDSVLIGTRCEELHATSAFDVQSSARSMRLSPRAGTYRVLASEPLLAAEGERLTTVLLPDREILMRVNEETSLADKAKTYDLPILGNPVSFREAHELVTGADLTLVEARRDRIRRGLDLFDHRDVHGGGEAGDSVVVDDDQTEA